MEQRDYLLRQIELMTQALVTLIRRLLGLKDIIEDEVEQITNETLSEYLDMSINQIMNTRAEELAEMMIQKNGINRSNLELFAEILVINAKAGKSRENQLSLLERALKLYQWIDNTGNTFSMERQQKMNEIQVLIENLKN